MEIGYSIAVVRQIMKWPNKIFVASLPEQRLPMCVVCVCTVQGRGYGMGEAYVAVGAATVLRVSNAVFSFSDYSIGGWRRRFMHFIVIIAIIVRRSMADVHCSLWSSYSMFSPARNANERTNERTNKQNIMRSLND